MSPIDRADPSYRLRHSAAHVMAQAVKEMFPEAKLGIGPAFLCLLQMALLPAMVLRSAHTGCSRAQLAA